MIQTNVSLGKSHEFRNWCQLHSWTDLTPKTYVRVYYYLFVGNDCGLIRIECFISNFVLWRGFLCIPKLVCTREEAEELSVVMSVAILCDWAETSFLFIFLTTLTTIPSKADAIAVTSFCILSSIAVACSYPKSALWIHSADNALSFPKLLWQCAEHLSLFLFFLFSWCWLCYLLLLPSECLHHTVDKTPHPPCCAVFLIQSARTREVVLH